MAATLHNALEKAGDTVPAAHAMLQAKAAMAGQGQADACTGKAYLSQHQVSELMRKHWGHSLQVRPSTVDHPDAGLGLFVQGHAPAGAVVALLPGVVYSRTQLSRMPNFPKVALDNPYLSSTIEMNVIDSKPWGLGVKVQQDPVGSFVQGPTNSQEASKAEFGPASSNSTPSTFSSSCVASSDASSSMESNTADKVTQCEPSSTSSSHSPTASHSGQTPPQPSLSTSHPPTGFPVSSTAYPSGHSAPQPPLLGYMSAYTQQPDGGMVPAPGSGSWTLAALEERHPLAWAHMANHPGPGMQPNVLEVPFEIDLGPPASGVEGGEKAEARSPHPAGQSTDDASAQAEQVQANDSACPCMLRAYIPCVPFVEPVPVEELAQKGWRQAAAEVLLEACGWPHAHKAKKSKQHDDDDDEDDEEEHVGFRLPGLPTLGGSSIRGSNSASRHKGMRVQGMALVATQALHDGDEVLLNYRLSPHTPRPPWYHSLDPEAEARRWAQMPLKGLLS
eukprot:CAMPEP_0202415992 /NCGR_PEP_ID=MMETSP1128-20130828/38151_1 /ASSEMBLY_ACC=CAM_ASM_000463 /TAXON_ID=3047 /ORGANISM="Dunaliella tertiolecta, Strain CCMP1320" /LENGTH=503 /DNA_ID=CAMNT_0049022861 /DNA_START=66 /DNA_END=1577 /DNA_ORIENTATION=-